MAAPKPIHDELHRIAITGIIWKKDDSGILRYLITKRASSKKAWPDKWTVPGGGLEVADYIDTEPTHKEGDSPQWYAAIEKTLRREIREEVGLEISDVRYLLDLTFIRPDGIPVVVLSFFCKYESGEVILDEDSTEYAWITAGEIKDHDLIPGIGHEIEMADERLRKEQQ